MQTLGIAISRRAASLVIVHKKGKSASIHAARTLAREPGAGVAKTLTMLLADVAGTRPGDGLALALSSADLACGDAWTLPESMTSKAAARVGAALCETRCATETLETLLVDTALSGTSAQALAVDRAVAQEILDAVRGFKLQSITAIPAALAQVYGKVSLTLGGERFDVEPREGIPSWRSHPTDGPDVPGALSWNGESIPHEQAAAFAAAVCDPERVPNLLNAFPQHRKTFLKRFRDPLLNIGAAAALCFGALGFQFHREAVRERDELAAARRAEMELWARFLPSEEPREGRLLKTMRERLGDLGETSGAADIPSALAFWGEIGKQMPDPEALGLTLESLDLAPDGGRLSARVPAAKEDPLKNAAQLEGRLNQSKKMTTRGDYEVRDGQVQVRLRMDYKP